MKSTYIVLTFVFKLVPDNSNLPLKIQKQTKAEDIDQPWNYLWMCNISNLGYFR